MKKFLSSALLFVLGLALGLSLNYLKIPSASSELGFYAGLICGAALLLLFFIGKLSRKQRSLVIIWLVITVTFAFSLDMILNNKLFEDESNAKGVESILLERKKVIVEERLLEHDQIIQDQILPLIKALEESNSVVLMEEELQSLQNISSLLKPIPYYPIEESDTVNLSFGRGRMLIEIMNSDIKPSIKQRIIEKVSFDHADLRGKDLAGLILSNIHAEAANFSNANLDSTNLDSANLFRSKFKAASLRNSTWISSFFQNADLSWADLSGADLSKSDLKGAQLINSVLINSILSDALAWCAKFNAANLKGSELNRTDLICADLSNANLDSVNFQYGRIKDVILDQTSFIDADLNGLTIDDKWLDNLKMKKIRNASEILSKYKVVKEGVEPFTQNKQHLRRKN